MLWLVGAAQIAAKVAEKSQEVSTLQKIIDKFLWEANGWVLVALAFAALAGFLLQYLASAAGNGPMAGMIGAVTTFIGISMVVTVVAIVFKQVIDFVTTGGG